MAGNAVHIGLLLEDIGSDFSKDLVRSVVNSIPPDKNIRLVVLPGKYDDPDKLDSYHTYSSVHNFIFRFSEVCRLDGIIIHLGTSSLNYQLVKQGKVPDRFKALPKVFIASDDKDLITVNYDNAMGIGEAVNYIVNICGMTRLCMLGGREDNKDARERKRIFTGFLEENGIPFESRNFINTDMTENCCDEAAELLDRNPGVQAIFCCNDAAAKGLYRVMKERDLTPGTDIMVFAFDNTNIAGELVPSLSSIGTGGDSLGQKALGMILDLINGVYVESALVPTRLYGRSSLPYEMYDYNMMELINVDPKFIERMFDDCFYRYRSSYRTHEMIDLRRLFFEIVSRMLMAVKQRYLSPESYDDICRLIDIFFDNGAMKYTDAAKLVERIDRFQAGVALAHPSLFTSVSLNKLLLRMKDNAILSLSRELAQEKNNIKQELFRLQDFTIDSMGYDNTPEENFNALLRSIGKFISRNAAFYMFEKPVVHSEEHSDNMPQIADLKCVIRDGNVKLIPDKRQRCAIKDVFTRLDMPKKCPGFIVFPVFHLNTTYGLLLCSPEGDIYDKGEFFALQLGRAVYLTGNK